MIKITFNKAVPGLILIMIISGTAMFIPGGILDITSTSEFCGLCHVMKGEYETWFLTGVHRNIKCVDCHVPNDCAVNHFIWKGIDGTKDVLFFYSRMFSDRITATGHAKKVIRKNCVRCHGAMVSRINVEERECWSCHRRINHKFADFSYINK